MPIRFRCSYCNRLLGIATRKAGTETICPHCGYTITVPLPVEEHGRADEDARTEQMNLDDVDALLGNAVTEVAAPPAAVAAPAVAPPAPAYPKPVAAPPAPKVRAAPPPVPKPVKHSSDDPPLFEGDMDAILGTTKPPEEPARARPPAVSGLDAMSLGDPPRNIVISGPKATLLFVLVVVLMVLSFVAGYALK